MSRNGSKTPTRTIKIYENQVFVKDFDSSAKVTYKLAGRDAKLFTVDSKGRLKFKAAPDYENPRDHGKNNVYDVTLIRDSSRKIREPERENLRIEICDKNEKSKSTGSIGDKVWFDKDGDGIQDRGEAGVAGVLVKLLSTGGKTLATTRTDANGKYLFDDLKPGAYKVKFYTPDGYEFTKRSSSNPEKSSRDSDATSSGKTYTIKLSKGEKQTKVDAGLVKDDPCDALIGDTVFFDKDGDGRRDSGEAGVAGVVVQLLTSSGKLIATTKTNASGKYVFDDLPSGNYRVKFIAPDGTEFTTRSSVGPESRNNDSDASTSTGITGVIKLGKGEKQKKIDAGLVESDTGDASIGDRVWIDANGDGERDNGESGAAGVTVELLDSDGDVVATTTTNAAGGYLFEDLDSGDYSVRFTAPDGYEFTVASGDAADAANNDSDANETTGETGTISLSIGEAERNIDAGLVETDTGTASIGDTVWIDADGDGLLNNGENGAAGVTVELLDDDGAVVGTTTTDADGEYLFDNLNAGDYRVRFTTPDGTEFTVASGAAADAENNDSDADETTGETGTINLSIGEAERDVDAGLVETVTGTASIGDTVFFDNDGDGIRDANDAGVGGVPVELLDSAGNVIATVETDNGGNYLFENLEAGDYRVRFTPANGFEFTTASADPADAVNDDSDADPATGETSTISLDDGEAERDVDAGIVEIDTGISSIGDTVWYDTDGDGELDNDEKGAAGATVELLDSDGAVVSTTLTDANGQYLFNALTAGDYRVRFTAPDGYEFTAASGAAADAENNDSDADETTGETGTIDLSIGEAELNIDAGLVEADPGTASIGDTVWIDANGDGQLNDGELGAAGVEVALLDSDGAVIETTTTNTDGEYLIDNLNAGDYRVRFTAPDGSHFTVASGDPADATDNDSDADVATGETGTINLSIGETERDVDAGLVLIDTGDASLGDTVWYDTDGDGELDDGENGAAGVTVELLDDDDAMVSTTLTDANGRYLFDNLNAGDYRVRFTAPDGYGFTTASSEAADATNGDSDADEVTGETGTVNLSIGEAEFDVDAGLVSTDPATASIGDTVWHDTDEDGQFNNGEAGAAGVTVELLDDGGAVVDTTTTDANGQYLFDNLNAGDYRVRFGKPDDGTYQFTTQSGSGPDVADNDSDAANNGETGTVTLSIGEAERNVDAGVVQIDVSNASVGDTVWYDTNGNGVRDGGESGAEAVNVVLVNRSGSVSRTTTTDANGNYLFENLPADEYQVSFGQPNGYDFTTPSADDPDATNDDSDASSAGVTEFFDLAIGEAQRNIDAGLVSTDPATGSIGDTVWYDLDGDGRRDPAEDGAEGITVELLDAGGSVLATETTDFNGVYYFEGLRAGDYRVRFTPSEGNGFTVQSSEAPGAVEDDSDADPATGETATITLGVGEWESYIDAGLVQEGPGTASLGDTVWFDANENGVRDPGEAGAAGVSVELIDAYANTVVATTTTDANGQYLFENLDSNHYSVRFQALPGYVFTTQYANGAVSPYLEDDDSDAYANGRTDNIPVQNGRVERSVDAGLVQDPNASASIGDTVFLDENGNGVRDAGEAGVAGVELLLTDANLIEAFDATTTDANGNYLFENLEAGDYRVQAYLPVGYDFATASTEAPDAVNDDNDIDPAGRVAYTGRTDAFTLSHGEQERDIDIGLVERNIGNSSISGTVWDDEDGDGTYGAELPVADVTVELLDADGTVVGTTTSDANGGYTFENLERGDYRVRFTSPDGYEFTVASGADPTVSSQDSDADPVTGETGTISVVYDDTLNSVHAGLVQTDPGTASIGDTVFLDSNRNGVRDDDEIGVQGLNVQLRAENDDLLETTTTDENGEYLFDGLNAGNYRVVFLNSSSDYEFTTQSSSEPGTENDDSDAYPSGATKLVALSVGETQRNVDAGLVQTDPGTASIGDTVWYELTLTGTRDVFEPPAAGITVELLSEDGDVLATTVTDDNGQYLFENLNAGDYRVRFTPVDGYEFFTASSEAPDAVNDDNDADPITGETGTISLEVGEAERDVDAALTQTDTGTASVGYMVWLDTNGNGVRDDGEPGMAGVTVRLQIDREADPGDGIVIARMATTAAGTIEPVGSTVTDANGYYLFENLDSNDYSVVFEAPDGYSFTTRTDIIPDSADDDSDAEETTGQTNRFTLSIGEEEVRIDAGLVPDDPATASIGDTVWIDANANGTRDNGEAGAAGVTVELLDDTGGVFATTSTGTDGGYLFADLEAGDYRVRFTAPDDFDFTTASGDAPEAADGDSDANVTTGETGTVTLAIGEEQDNVDAGLVAKTTGGVGDTVWDDTDGDGVRDEGEPGVAGVQVGIINRAGSFTGGMRTDENGQYLFEDLPPGEYQVSFTLPEGYEFTTKSSVAPRAANNDSDADANGVTDWFDLGAGEYERDIDAGFIPY